MMIKWEPALDGRDIPFVPGSDNFIPMEKWGKDHWSMLAYIEAREVDYKGVLNGDHMRCNSRLHRTLVGRVSVARKIIFTHEYPTILKGGEVQHNHDDWSCIEDMAHIGLVTAETAKTRDLIFGSHEARVKLTQRGRVLANQLREHKANGGNFSNFEPKENKNDN